MTDQGMHKVVVLGAGESGVGSALLAKSKGLEVFVSDSGRIKQPYKIELMTHAIPFEEGSHTMECILDAGVVIKSPGIPDDAPIMNKIQDHGLDPISELEWGWMSCTSKVIAVTGSNGKTTTTSLIYHLLKGAGIDAQIGGNIGTSFARLVSKFNPEWWVLEVSSFQLDGIKTFRPDIAVLLNISPDHLDRYGGDLRKYTASKMRITENQESSDAFVFWAEDPAIEGALKDMKVRANTYPFSWTKTPMSAAWIEDDRMFLRTNNTTIDMTLENLALQGRHNVYNSMAAGVVSRLLEIRKESIRQSFSDFQGIMHRLERVATIRGVDFINDSKATNVNSVWYALESMNKPVIWIAGGIDKGNDYSALKELAKKKVKALVCLGADNTKLIEAFKDEIKTIIVAKSAAEAVRSAFYTAEPGETVLLSPACASFDLFESYEDRGEQFKRAVREL